MTILLDSLRCWARGIYTNTRVLNLLASILRVSVLCIFRDVNDICLVETDTVFLWGVRKK